MLNDTLGTEHYSNGNNDESDEGLNGSIPPRLNEHVATNKNQDHAVCEQLHSAFVEMGTSWIASPQQQKRPQACYPVHLKALQENESCCAIGKSTVESSNNCSL